MAWILAYDIACPRRWRKIYRLARERGVRLQWSVFLVTEPGFDPRRFLGEAANIIDLGADDLRLYRVAGSIVGNIDRRAVDEPMEGVQWRGPSPRAIARLRSNEPEKIDEGDGALTGRTASAKIIRGRRGWRTET